MSILEKIPLVGETLARWETDIDFWWAKQTFSAQSRKMFYRRFAAQTARKKLPNGKTLKGKTPIEALEILELIYTENGTKPNSTLGRLCNMLRFRINNGVKLAAAFEGWAPASELSIIAAGEESNNLAESFYRAILMIEKSQEMTRGIKHVYSAAMLVVVIIGIMVWFSTTLIPEFRSLLPSGDVPGAAGLMITIADIVAAWWIPFVAALAITIATIAALLPRLTGPARRVLDNFAIFREYRLIQGSKLMVSIATLMDAGRTETEALQELLKHATPYVRERLELGISGIGDGGSFASSMLKAKMNFPEKEILYDLSASAGSKLSGEAVLVAVVDWLTIAVISLEARFKAANTLLSMAVAVVVMLMYYGTYDLFMLIRNSSVIH